MNVSAARERLPEAIETERAETAFLQRCGRLAGVLISPERYEQLMTAREDAEDVEAFDAAMAEEVPSIPWEQVRADLGWG
jgi:PHD/YefM family antitoxin component YafN of YafNO toxin-antitoxin module